MILVRPTAYNTIVSDLSHTPDAIVVSNNGLVPIIIRYYILIDTNRLLFIRSVIIVYLRWLQCFGGVAREYYGGQLYAGHFSECIHVCMYLWVYVCIGIYIYIYIYIYCSVWVYGLYDDSF